MKLSIRSFYVNNENELYLQCSEFDKENLRDLVVNQTIKIHCRKFIIQGIVIKVLATEHKLYLKGWSIYRV